MTSSYVKKYFCHSCSESLVFNNGLSHWKVTIFCPVVGEVGSPKVSGCKTEFTKKS